MQDNTKDSKSKTIKKTKTKVEMKTTIKPKTNSTAKTAVKPKTKSTTKTTKKTSKKTTTKSNNLVKKTTKRTKSNEKNKAIKDSNATKQNKKNEMIEYYDLPNKYDQTIVKILAQTPKTLFVYWEISEEDRKKYIKKYGEKFFENTYPVLIVHNRTMNYSFEIEINDFANSWYFNVNDVKCEYEIELGRRKRNIEAAIALENNYLQITSSNYIEAPNNHILFEKKQKTIFFRDVKTNQTYSRETSNIQFMKYVGRIYNIYDIYKKIYKNDELVELEHNPSSIYK